VTCEHGRRCTCRRSVVDALERRSQTLGRWLATRWCRPQLRERVPESVVIDDPDLARHLERNSHAFVKSRWTGFRKDGYPQDERLAIRPWTNEMPEDAERYAAELAEMNEIGGVTKWEYRPMFHIPEGR
jgi:hypothetical protein